MIRALRPGFFSFHMMILLAYISGLPHRDDPYISMLPCGLCYMHSCLREAGFDSMLANFSGWTDNAIKRQLQKLKPSFLAISQWTHNRHKSMELARVARRLNPGCVIVMGGGHATFQPEAILQPGSPVDFVLMGEGEQTLLELAGYLTEGRAKFADVRGIAFRIGDTVVTTPPRVLLSDLDSLPFASRYLEYSIGVDQDVQAEFIVTARGCPSACTFCSSPAFWKRRVRYRSPENIVDEILSIRDRYGLIYFSMRDDTFTADRRRTIDICRLLIERRAHIMWNCQSRVTALDEEVLVWMKRAGCECVQIGVESGSPRVLTMLGKEITSVQVEHAAAAVRRAGISLSVYLISDVPGETEEDRVATIALMRRVRPDDGYVSPLAYYPGTRLFLDAIDKGRVSVDIFQKNRDPAVYASPQPVGASRKLLQSFGGIPVYGRELKRLKRLLGYCYVTNAMAGEYFRQQGEYAVAESEFREITERESDNPWGWFLLGELLAEQGRYDEAAECYRRVLERVPRHSLSLRALGR